MLMTLHQLQKARRVRKTKEGDDESGISGGSQHVVHREAVSTDRSNLRIFGLIQSVRLRPDFGRGSSVGIATGYGLDGPGIESRWGRDVPHLSRPTLGPTQPPVQWVLGLYRG
jgi:hypothetical protein